MPRGVTGSGKARAPKRNFAQITRDKVSAEISKLEEELAEHEEGMKTTADKLRKARAVLVALDSYADPAAPAPSPTPRVAPAPPVVPTSEVKTAHGPRNPGVPEAITQVVDYLRLRGNEVSVLPDGRFKANGVWTTKSQLVDIANRIRKSRGERAFEFPNGV